jgi:hypothetical protein
MLTYTPGTITVLPRTRGGEEEAMTLKDVDDEEDTNDEEDLPFGFVQPGLDAIGLPGDVMELEGCSAVVGVNAFGNLEDALAVLPDGATLYLLPGTYVPRHGAWELSRSITLQGLPSDRTSFGQILLDGPMTIVGESTSPIQLRCLTLAPASTIQWDDVPRHAAFTSLFQLTTDGLLPLNDVILSEEEP